MNVEIVSLLDVRRKEIFRSNISPEQADNRLTKHPLLPGWPLSNIHSVTSYHENNENRDRRGRIIIAEDVYTLSFSFIAGLTVASGQHQ